MKIALTWFYPTGMLLCMAATSAIAAADPIANPAIIAHRGDSYHAPESTIPAYLLACEAGADYLELDLQRSKDGQLIALHDNNLKRTTNVASVFPDRAADPISSFTLAELEQLDAGSWFNQAYPERARDAYAGLKIVTLDQISEIAKGCQSKPGLYIETKVPEQFPGIEADLKSYLAAHGWLDEAMQGKVILQTFEKPSLVELQKQMPNVPKILLLWTGDGYIDEKPVAAKTDDESWADYYLRVEVASKQAFEAWLDFAKQHGAVGVGPSTIQSEHAGPFSSQFSYMDLALPWMVEMSHAKGLLVHAYTVDQVKDFEMYRQRGVDGFFTNNPEVAAKVFGRDAASDVESLLTKLSY